MKEFSIKRSNPPRRKSVQAVWQSGFLHLSAIIAVLIALLAFESACSPAVKKQNAAQASVPVAVSVVAAKDVSIQVGSMGNAEAYATVTVRPQVGGQLVSVLFSEGQEVHKGQLLFKIDPRPYEQVMNQSEAALARDSALAKQAAADEVQYASLLKGQFIAQSVYDQYHATATAAAATVKADEAQVEGARLQLAYCAVSSPIDGRTGSLLVDMGNIVQANTTPLVTINTLSPIYATFTLPEKYLSEVRSASSHGHMKVAAFPSGGEKDPAEGTLVFIDNSVDSSTGTFQMKGLFANRDERLWPGEYLNVVLTLGMQREVPVVPGI
jgi:multidrug efflux system membrane fusion protein